MATIQRKMASIQRIKDIIEIPGAENIETAVVNGWTVVVKKGEFKVNDLAVFCEIDSFIPTTIAPFLTKEGYPPNEFNGVKGERLKTTKRMKQLSQGLLLPLDAKLAPQLASPSKELCDYAEGDDVTEALGVQKWEPAEEAAEVNGPKGAKTRAFPYFIRKTDQERAQNYGHMIAQNLDTEFEVTVKKDGSSMTVFRVDPSSPYYADAKKQVGSKRSLWQRIKDFVLRKKDEAVYGICSRNVLLPLEGNSNFHKAAKAVIEQMVSYEGIVPYHSYAVQGEVIAPDIQGNYEKVKDVEFHIFDLFDIDHQEYVYQQERRCVVAGLGLNHVKVVDKGTLRSILNLQDGEDPVQKLLPYASGEGDNPGVKREGVVFKAEGKDFSFKVVSNEYLLAKDKKG